MATQDDDADEPMGYDHPQFIELMETLEKMHVDMRPRFLRMMERVAALPPDVQKTVTRAQMQHMLDNDADFPYN